jgi:hypothetical protein
MLAAALVALGVASGVSPSDARVPGPTFSLAYAGGGDCPSRANFEAAIVARAPNARSTENPEQAEVRFEVEELGPRRRLHAALRDGTSQDREIDADDCAEAVQSMAVIAAMILASREAPAQPDPVAPAPKVQGTVAPKPPAAPKAVPSTPKAAPTAATSNARRSRPTSLDTGGGLGLESGAAPDLAYAASAFVELGRRASGVLAPSLRVTALFGQAPEVRTSAGKARFRLLLGRVHGCGLRFGDAEVTLRLCAVVDGGALFAEGIDALNERSKRIGWAGAGLGAIGGWRLAQRWTLELAGGARALLVRDAFVFAPHVSIHQVPDIAWDSKIDLCYRAW